MNDARYLKLSIGFRPSCVDWGFLPLCAPTRLSRPFQHATRHNNNNINSSNNNNNNNNNNNKSQLDIIFRSGGGGAPFGPQL